MDERCPSCGARRQGDMRWCGQCLAPLSPAFAGPSWPTHLARPAMVAAPPADLGLARPAPATQEPHRSRPAIPDNGSLRTALGAIALGVVVNLVVFAAASSGTIEPTNAIGNELWATVGLYALVAALALTRGRRADFQPIWTQGDATQSGLVGAAAGAGCALAVLSASWAATGEVKADPRITLIVSEGTWARIGAALLVTTVLAPLIEELLFRGLVVESLRPKGAGRALLVSAALFSVWHLNGSAFFYYLLAGAMLASLYWRRGLKCSIAAHAAFNGCITVMAVLLVVGPGRTVSSNGVSARMPGAWQGRTDVALGANGDLVADGPSGSHLVIGHRDTPGAGAVNVDDLAARLGAGTLDSPVPGVTVEPGSARLVQGRGWRGVRISTKSAEETGDGDVVVIPKGDRLYQVTLLAVGSSRAQADFDRILDHLSLP